MTGKTAAEGKVERTGSRMCNNWSERTEGSEAGLHLFGWVRVTHHLITHLGVRFSLPSSLLSSTMPKRTGFIAWYDRLISSFSIEDLFVRRLPPGPPRTIFINEPLPESYYDKKHRVLKEHQYNSNQVITSKYTLFTFLPRNLLEQFRRTANV